MLVIIGIMGSGILLGWLLRKTNLGIISKIITVLIWLLLFLLGVEAGGNEKIMNSLPTLGVEGLVIAAAGTFGSVMGASLLWRWLRKPRKLEEKA